MTKGSEKNSLPRRSHWLKLLLELTAVFVGITAGFFFENFREERADRIQEEKFIASFLTNVRTDSALIEEYISDFTNNLEISERVLGLMNSGPIERDSAFLLMGIMGTYNDLFLQDATYESVINSGKLELIRDYALREDILKYYQSLKSLQYVDGVYNKYVDNFVFPYIFGNLDFISGEMSEGFDPNHRDFRNISVAYYVMVSAKVEAAKDMDSLNHVLRLSLLDYVP